MRLKRLLRCEGRTSVPCQLQPWQMTASEHPELVLPNALDSWAVTFTQPAYPSRVGSTG